MPKSKIMHGPRHRTDVIRIARPHQHHNNSIKLPPIHVLDSSRDKQIAAGEDIRQPLVLL
jgi:hypothetical protein